jgi:hypothetical protein
MPVRTTAPTYTLVCIRFDRDHQLIDASGFVSNHELGGKPQANRVRVLDDLLDYGPRFLWGEAESVPSSVHFSGVPQRLRRRSTEHYRRSASLDGTRVCVDVRPSPTPAKVTEILLWSHRVGAVVWHFPCVGRWRAPNWPSAGVDRVTPQR